MIIRIFDRDGFEPDLGLEFDDCDEGGILVDIDEEMSVKSFFDLLDRQGRFEIVSPGKKHKVNLGSDVSHPSYWTFFFTSDYD